MILTLEEPLVHSYVRCTAFVFDTFSGLDWYWYSVFFGGEDNVTKVKFLAKCIPSVYQGMRGWCIFSLMVIPLVKDFTFLSVNKVCLGRHTWTVYIFFLLKLLFSDFGTQLQNMLHIVVLLICFKRSFTPVSPNFFLQGAAQCTFPSLINSLGQYWLGILFCMLGHNPVFSLFDLLVRLSQFLMPGLTSMLFLYIHLSRHFWKYFLCLWYRTNLKALCHVSNLALWLCLFRMTLKTKFVLGTECPLSLCLMLWMESRTLCLCAC